MRLLAEIYRLWRLRAEAMGEEMGPPLVNSNNKIALTLWDDAEQPITDAAVTIAVKDPANNEKLAATAMTHVGSGRYEYTLAATVLNLVGEGYKALFTITKDSQTTKLAYTFAVVDR